MSPVLICEEKPKQRAKSDEALVRDCLRGSQEAWSELIEKYKALIYSIPVKYGLPPQDAADIFQGTCLELLSSLPLLREPRALPKWLIQVAHHKCHHWKLQQQRFVTSEQEDGAPEPEVPPIADALIRQTEEEQGLREAIAALPSQCRQLVRMLFFETPPRAYSEVARDLGLAVGSIGLTRQRFVERLRKQLEEMGFA